MVQIRFHLGKGENYMKWQIKTKGIDGQTQIHYLDNSTNLTLVEPKLCNQKATAEKIFNGANKSVCSWIECEDILLGVNLKEGVLDEEVFYNPRKQPNWTDSKGNNLDGKQYSRIIIQNKVIKTVKNVS